MKSMKKIYKTVIEARTFDNTISFNGFLKQGQGGFNFSFNIDPGIDVNGFIKFLEDFTGSLKRRSEPYKVREQLKRLGKTLDRQKVPTKGRMML